MEYSARRLLRSKALKSVVFASYLLLPKLPLAQDLTVIGGTSIQKRLTACIERVSAEDLGKLPGSDHSLTVVILERERFLQLKSSFGAYQTKLAFSNLAIRRMYLSSDVFKDLDTALRCIPHELGHFVTRSVYENHAEIAAGRIRQRALELCTMPAEPVPSRTLSSQVNRTRPDEAK
jgi:hypothetical protein